MNTRLSRVYGGCLLLAVAASCTTAPTSPAGGVTVTTATLVSPGNGAQIAHIAQPVTLTVTNAFVTGDTSAVTYTFEVATDVAFANKVLTKDVAQAAGQTSLKLDALVPGRDYYWHVRTTGADTVGVFTVPMKFTIGQQVVLQPPVASAPANGAGNVVVRPTLTVTNVARSGPAGSIVYRFDLATSATFSAILASGTVPEGAGGQTSFTPSSDLPVSTTFFWRAQALDNTNNVTTAFSSVQSFATLFVLDLHTVNYQRFVNVADWKVTASIIAVEQDGGTGDICINHTKRGLWPVIDFFGDPGGVESNQWYLAKINGVWYAGSGEWTRPNQICKGGQFSNTIGPDGGWGGPMDTWVPKVGELVGYMVTTPARAYPTMKTVDERSDVVIQPWVDTGSHAASLRIKK